MPPGKHSWGRAWRSTPPGTLISSESGPLESPGEPFQASILGFSLFFLKERLLPFPRVAQFPPAPWLSSLVIKGGTKTDRTSGSREERLLTPLLWTTWKRNNKSHAWFPPSLHSTLCLPSATGSRGSEMSCKGTEGVSFPPETHISKSPKFLLRIPNFKHSQSPLSPGLPHGTRAATMCPLDTSTAALSRILRRRLELQP